MFITFIFKMPHKSSETFYGKYYTDNISDEHEGLDNEIKPYLLKGINAFKRLEHSHDEQEEQEKNIHIGIISVSNDKYISIHSTDNEMNCFDFFCKKFTINHKMCLTLYMFGKSIKCAV